MTEKVPLIRLAKREDMAKSRIWLIRLLAFALALILGGLVFVIAGADPITAYSTMVAGSLGKVTGIRQVVKVAVPLLGTALALAPCFAMRYWNIGAEGQITMGAMMASFFALKMVNAMPSPVLLIVMGISAALMGALWAGIPAFFKAHWGTNETLFTLMMNYIAIGIVGWLQGGPWEGKPGSQIIPMFDEKAVLPSVFGVHIGWIIVLILTFLMYIYMTKTKHGYEIAVLGESENTARYAGMDVRRVMLRTACLSGGIAGLVGFMICSGADETLYQTVAGGVGFTAITVTWLAQLNPFAMIAISLLLAILSKGASTIQTTMGVPASISDIITGIILLCMLGCEFFINYKMIFRGHEEHPSAPITAQNTEAPGVSPEAVKEVKA
ncbi:MAG: ABC transporter permease [Firmicutes bacterium]|nr:ABC transporter permease [Bacillota bacterium]